MPSWIKHSSMLQHLQSIVVTHVVMSWNIVLSVMCWVDWITADMKRIFQATVSPTCVQRRGIMGPNSSLLTPVREGMLKCRGFQRQSVKLWSINVWVTRPMSYFMVLLTGLCRERNLSHLSHFSCTEGVVIMVVRYSTGFLSNTI